MPVELRAVAETLPGTAVLPAREERRVPNQSVGRRSNVGTARVKSHVIRVQNASKLGEKA